MKYRCVDRRCRLYGKKISLNTGYLSCPVCGKYTEPCPENAQERDEIKPKKKFSREAFNIHTKT